jgi:HPt (histidine-containing phosphotransfer) domain-containing protein
MEKRDFKELELSAHTLKGVISNMYADRARLLAWQLEQMGHSASAESAEKIYLELETELIKLVSELQPFAKTGKPK